MDVLDVLKDACDILLSDKSMRIIANIVDSFRLKICCVLWKTLTELSDNPHRDQQSVFARLHHRDGAAPANGISLGRIRVKKETGKARFDDDPQTSAGHGHRPSCSAGLCLPRIPAHLPPTRLGEAAS